MKIKKDDKVIITTGKDKGKEGKVLTVFPAEDKLIVEGINVVKKHAKARQSDKKGEIVDKAMPVHISNVALLDPKDGKPTRIGYKVEGDTKVRIAKRSGDVIK